MRIQLLFRINYTLFMLGFGVSCSNISRSENHGKPLSEADSLLVVRAMAELNAEVINSSEYDNDVRVSLLEFTDVKKNEIYTAIVKIAQVDKKPLSSYFLLSRRNKVPDSLIVANLKSSIRDVAANAISKLSSAVNILEDELNESLKGSVYDASGEFELIAKEIDGATFFYDKVTTSLVGSGQVKKGVLDFSINLSGENDCFLYRRIFKRMYKTMITDKGLIISGIQSYLYDDFCDNKTEFIEEINSSNENNFRLVLDKTFVGIEAKELGFVGK
ncbi:MAG: hypothetical protein MUE72_08125, partial [Chitinophagaceae bacterium]|nr:hypothetical protein [Chitinophagaceae bacterium]